MYQTMAKFTRLLNGSVMAYPKTHHPLNRLLIKPFCFSSDFDETWWSCSYPCVLQFHQVSSKSDEKQKSFLNSLFFCSEFQSVSRIVKIEHSAHIHYSILQYFPHLKSTLLILYCYNYFNFFSNSPLLLKIVILIWKNYFVVGKKLE